MKTKAMLVVSALLASSLVAAQPSTYYLWKHKTTGQTMCEPDADANWVKVAGPYEDSNCRILAKQ